jgi:hypothetical protein
MAKNEATQCCDGAMTPIVYGYPSDKMFASAQRNVELGGCCISDDMPMFRCDRCGRTVGRLEEPMNEYFKDDI